MITTLLFAATLPTAVDAERAFNADAQRLGQWTAFRKYAAPDAVMFTPQAVWARDFLKGKKDPPRSVRWRPALSFVSCDGRTAVNTGPWYREGNKHGTFTTVWQRAKGRWTWVYDGGQDGKGAAPPWNARPKVRRATCKPAPGAPVIPPRPLTEKQARTTPEDSGKGESADRTLGWDWKVEKDGSRKFRAYLWNGRRYLDVLTETIPAQ